MRGRHLVAVAILGALIGLWISPGRAYAAPEHAAAPVSAPRLAAHSVPPCEWEDGSGQPVCIWAGDIMGNGIGSSAVVRNGGTGRDRVRLISHKNARRLLIHGAYYAPGVSL